MTAAGDTTKGFEKDVIGPSVQKEVGALLSDKEYDSKGVQTWAQQLSSSVLKILVSNNTLKDVQYKYVVNTLIMERTGGGLHSTSSCLWDKQSDNSCSIQWNNDKLLCVVSIWALRCS